MRIINPTDLGLAIRDRRRKLGLGQRELADRVGVSRQWIVEVEHGKARAEVGLVLRTLQALEIGLFLEAGDSTEPTVSAQLGENKDSKANIAVSDLITVNDAVQIDALIERARGDKR
jgi:HTH-type transcriptional regulator / antitoxin HipB